MQKTKILLIGSFPPPYHGSAIYLNKLSKKLAQENDLQVFIIDTSDKRHDLKNLGRLNLINVVTAVKSILKLICFLLSKKPDIVYIPISQNKLAYLRDGIFIAISKIMDKKVLIHLHGSYFLDFYKGLGKFYKKFIDLTIKSVDGAIVLGQKLRYIFEHWLPAEKVFVLPNFIEWNLRSYNFDRNKNNKVTNITYLGNLLESKGIFDLLEAIKIVKASVDSKFIVNIAGQFSNDSTTGLSLEEHMVRFKSYLIELADVVNYIGEIREEKDKYELLKNTDIFVFPSWYRVEGQPLVILEAMSCGCPIISTRGVGVIDETVIDGVNGLLVEKRNVEKLAEAILKLIKDRDLRKAMGRESKKRFEQEYTPEKHVEKFKQILIKIMFGERMDLKGLNIIPQ